MRFLALLQNGATAQSVAKRFIDELLERSEFEADICMETATEFVNECFSAIGFRSNLTPQHFDTEEGFKYEWPPEWRVYSFSYNPLLFAGFERFIALLGIEIYEQQEAYIAANQMSTNEYYESDELADSPVVLMMELLAVWCNAYRNLQLLEENATTKRFEEPLARINFQHLLGMHNLRKLYGNHFRLLGSICHRLYCSVVQGIFYHQTHDHIVAGLLDLFESDLYLFYEHSVDILNFFYDALSVENKQLTYILVYKRLQNMLNTSNECSNQPNMKNFLAQTRMLEVYFTTLKFEKNKRLLLAVLNFLKTFQSMLLDLACFTQAFLQAILALVLHRDKLISDIAAELYITMMNRKLSYDLVLKDILDFYLYAQTTPDSLIRYVQVLRKHFTFMTSITAFDIYFDIVTNAEYANNLIRLLTAEFMFVVYQEMLNNIETFRREIAYILLKLPEKFKEIECNNTIGLGLRIFAITDFELLRNYLESAEAIVLKFEDYAIEEFSHNSSLECPLLINLFSQLIRCLNETNNWHKLEEMAVELYREYQQFENKLKARALNLKESRQYRDILQRISILLKTNYELFDSMEELFDSLKKYFMEGDVIHRLASKTNTFIDIYIIEILICCVIKLFADTSLSVEKKEIIIKHAIDLEKHLIGCLSDGEDWLSVPVIRIKTIFQSLLSLYCTFYNFVKLNISAYNLLTQVLIVVAIKAKKFNVGVGDEPTHMHSKRILEYQSMMLQSFCKLHASEHIVPPTNITWKLCIYYGMSFHKMNAELALFLKTLAAHQLQTYKHILPVLIYNLYKQQPLMTEQMILRAIKAHKDLIDKDLAVSNPALLNVHIVLSVLQIVERALRVLHVNASVNRLVALKNLNAFIHNIDLAESSVLNDIRQQAEALQNYLLTAAERKSLCAYLQSLKNV